MKREFWVILGGIAIFLVILVIGANTENTGGLSGLTSDVSTFVNNTIDRFPDRPSTEDVIAWSRKCQAGQASQETCERVGRVSTAKQQACAARMGVRDLVVAGISKMNTEQMLEYCEQRFPDPR